MAPKKCCVVGCEDQTSSRHRFPNPKKHMNKFREWLEKTGNVFLHSVDPGKVYANYRVCHMHFRPEDVRANMILWESAVPSRFLPAFLQHIVDTPDVEVEVEVSDGPILDTPSTSTGIHSCEFAQIVPEDLNCATPKRKRSSLEISLSPPSNISLDVPSTSYEESGADLNFADHIYCSTFKHRRVSAEINSTTTLDISLEIPSTSNEESASDLFSSDHIYCFSSLQRSPSPERTTDKSKKLLQQVGVSRVGDLTPKAKILYKTNRKTNKSLDKLRRSSRVLKTKLTLSKQDVLDRATSSLQTHVAKFIKSQINLSDVAPQGRRYSVDDKVLGLILHKQSGKAYNTFSQLFFLPSTRTLQTLLNRIPLNTGVNEPLFKNLKANVMSLKESEKICVILFDEMQIQPQVIYNKHTKEFEGFEDFGDKRTPEIADHALVFMVKGLLKKWKQPLTYSFCQGTTKTIDLVRQIKLVIRECQDAGLKVIATVCDQGSTNVAAINHLVRTSGLKKEVMDLKMSLVNRQPIIHIFDVPHLLKGIRNNFLNKDMVWNKDGVNICGKWDHIVKVFEEDNTPGELRTLPKITEAHVYEAKMKKMKVSHAAQIFSHTLAAQMSLLARKGIINDEGAKETSQILLFFDKLFDSLNGHTLWPSHGKDLKCAVSIKSGHLPFWLEARKQLTNTQFCTRSGEMVTPSLKNFKTTIVGMEELLNLLRKDFNVNFFFPREINQDPIENFFGQMRQHGGRNVNPSVEVFKNHFRTLLINNLVNRHSLNANCEEDNSTLIINGIRTFVTQGLPEEDYDATQKEKGDVMEILRNCEIMEEKFSYITKVSIGYVSGFIAKNLKTVKTCSSCRNNIICRDSLIEWHDFVNAKEYVGDCTDKLKKCTPAFLIGLSKIYNTVMQVIHHIYFKKKCISTLIEFLMFNLEFNFVNTCEHRLELKRIIIEKFVGLLSFNWASGINNILLRKDTRVKSNDVVYKKALQYVNKRKHK